MENLLFMIIVSVVIKYSVDPIKKLYSWIMDLKKDKVPKIGIPVAFLIGIVAGMTSNIGIVESLLQSFGIDFVVNDVFHYTDIFFACMLYTGLSGGIMALVETLPDILSKVLIQIPKKNQ